VDVLNQKDEHFMKISASEVAMIDSVSGAPLVKLSTTAGGCFGQSVLVGKRREAKHVAFTPCEVWSIAKEDLRELFTAYPKAARLICQQVLGDYVRFDRLRLLSVKMAIALEPTRSKRTLLRCALQWKEQTNINLMVHDNLYQVGSRNPYTAFERAMYSKPFTPRPHSRDSECASSVLDPSTSYHPPPPNCDAPPTGSLLI
jgi:hypothetical protein